MSLENLTPQEEVEHRLGKLLLQSNPEIQMEAKKLARKANPNLRLPEVDLEEKLEAERAARRELEDKIERQRIEDRVAERERKVKEQIEQAGYTLAEIEKIVKDEQLHGEAGIATALKLAQLQREAAAPGAAEITGNYAGPQDMRGDADLRKKSPADLRRWSNDTAHEMMNEALRRLRGSARGG